MTNWTPGDLAVCILTQGRPSPLPNDGCAKDRIYRVERVVHDDSGNVGLVLEGLCSTHLTGGYLASCYRKVVRDGLGDEVLNRRKVTTHGANAAHGGTALSCFAPSRVSPSRPVGLQSLSQEEKWSG